MLASWPPRSAMGEYFKACHAEANGEHHRGGTQGTQHRFVILDSVAKRRIGTLRCRTETDDRTWEDNVFLERLA